MLLDLASHTPPSRGSGERRFEAAVGGELCAPEDFCDVELRLPVHGAGNSRQRLGDGGGVGSNADWRLPRQQMY